jgi:ParB family transcriptional regulator, chromosome partitioning protein
MPPIENNTDAPPKRRALGRGLNALFGEDENDHPSPTFGASENNEDGNETTSHTPLARKLVSISQLVPGKYQPRHHFNDATIAELAKSISQHGLIQPILVRPLNDGSDSYEIVAGERRWRAAQKAQLHEVPIIIRELDDTTTLEIALIENLQREDLNAVDEARALKQLSDQFDYSHDQVAEKIGKSRSYVANMLRLIELCPPVLMMLTENKISAGHARALLSLSAEQQEEQARKIAALGLSVRQTEKLVGDLQGRGIKSRVSTLGKKISSASKADDKDLNTLALEREVSNVLGMDVKIDMSSQQEGSLTISFKSLDQLDEVLHRLSHNPGRLAIKG